MKHIIAVVLLMGLSDTHAKINKEIPAHLIKELMPVAQNQKHRAKHTIRDEDMISPHLKKFKVKKMIPPMDEFNSEDIPENEHIIIQEHIDAAKDQHNLAI